MGIRDLTIGIVGSFLAALCVVAALMLITFPLQRIHHSYSHFRTSEIRRSAARHTSLERSPDAASVEAVGNVAGLLSLRLRDDEDSEQALDNTAIISNVPVRLFLMRLKMAPSRTGAQDPLVQ